MEVVSFYDVCWYQFKSGSKNVVKGTDKVVNSKGFEVGVGSFLSTAGKAAGNASSNFSIKQSQPENTVTTPSQSYYQEDRNW